MQLGHLSVLALLTGLLSPGTAGFAQGKPSLYESVQAILSENCLSCHGAAQMSGLDLSQRDTLLKGGSRGPALVPGKAEESLLFQAVAHSGELRMPPESARLPREKLDLIRRWIDAGALWKESGSGPAGEEPDWWSFRKPRRPPLPPVDGQQWKGNPIDAFVLAKLREKGLPAAPAADKRTLIRRAYFDLIGLPPTPEQVERFLKDELAPGLSVGGERVAGLSPLRGTLGTALAGRGSLRRLGRVRNRRLLPPCLALPGLRHQVLQRRQALRPLPSGADRSRRALAQQPRPGRELRHRRWTSCGNWRPGWGQGSTGWCRRPANPRWTPAGSSMKS